ncbi:MAG TPA: glycosyltransferase [Pedobacter sp.]|nr:glycosyltransferase [Pedobacter sp.]
MKIIQISPSYKPAYIYGGTISSIALLCEALVERDLELEVITTTANGRYELPVSTAEPCLVDGVNVRYFKRHTRDHTHFSPTLIAYIYRTTSANQKDLIIHIHSWWNLTAVLSFLMARYRKIPIILSPRGMLTPYSKSNRHEFLKYILQWLIGRKLFKHCLIHATSEKEHQDILTLHSKARITIIPNLVKTNTATNTSIHHNDTFNLIFLSRIEEKKGLEFLFEALQHLDFNWKLTLAGTGDDTYIEKLKNTARTLKINTLIAWTGHIDDSRKYHVIAQSDLLVLFSFNENFANVVAESLSVGTPVAISDQVGLAPFVAEHDLGWICIPDPLKIAQVLKLAHQDQKKRIRIRKTAPALISEHFSRQHLVDQYLSMYQRSL